MVHEMITSLPPGDVLDRARSFFAERVPHYGAFLEDDGPTHATFRGQGGEEIAIAVIQGSGATRIRASTLLYDQAVGRFFSTLPPASTGSQDAA